MRPLAVIVAIALTACSPAAPDPGPTSEHLNRILELRRDASIQAVRYSNGLRDPATTVIRDSQQWRAAWTAITANHSPMPLPAVDFSRDMVVLVALGTKSSGGYTAEITRVATSGSGVTVDYSATSPGDRCGTTGALTQPLDFVIVQRVDGDAAFTRHDRTTNC